MLPVTRQMMGRMRPGSEPDSRLEYDEVASHSPDDLMRLELKRRYKLKLIREMLQDAGYDELAQMTRAKNI